MSKGRKRRDKGADLQAAGNTPPIPLGREQRLEWVKEKVLKLMSDSEIVELAGRTQDDGGLGVAKCTAYNDIRTVMERSWHTGQRGRMQLSVTEARLELFRQALKDRELDIANRVLNGLSRSLKLDVTPEELLGDEELRDKVFRALVGQVHTFTAEQRAELSTAIGRLLEDKGDGPLSEPPEDGP